ncbi:MAG: hemolysin family protein [Planctomycetota bacterium]|nr:hemolysin family protein [Planctomycetota bacterium]MEC9048643.1 hemolysin family protein [Planctomycetota bacterium]
MLLLVLAVSFSLVFSFVCSISEATLLSVGPARVEQLGQSGSRLGKLLQRFRAEPDRPIAAILIVNTISNSGGAAIATAQFTTAFPGVSEAWFAAFFVVTVLAVTEIVPKTIGVMHADQLAIPITGVVQVMIVAVWPMLFLTRLLARCFARSEGRPTTSLDEIRVMATAGMSQGAFGKITGELIQNATKLRDLTAKDVMVSRDRVTYLSGNQPTEDNLKRVQRTGHSRFPYTPTGELDDVKGVVLTKQLLFHLRDREAPEWESLLVDLLIVPESATLNNVLRKFQVSRRHMAIVVDEYGSTEGIVTLEDVLEEIVGEIEDESDTMPTLIIERADGTLMCRGVAEVADVFEKLALQDVETESKTLSGFLSERLDNVPTAGAHVDVGGFRFEVTKANNRRAERVRVTRLDPVEPS